MTLITPCTAIISKVYSSLLKAFTLAEVLIVLGIIGLIADMTIPTLVSKFQEQVVVVKLKKVYSTLSSAYNLAVMEEGTPENWNMQSSEDIKNRFAKYVTLIKDDGGRPPIITDPRASFVTPDGTLIEFARRSSDCIDDRGDTPALKTVCAAIGVYLKPNGKNINGKDVFFFVMTKKGIIPHGTEADTRYPFETTCLNSLSLGCTAWVIYNGNMDYLHCNDLSWTGKKSCK